MCNFAHVLGICKHICVLKTWRYGLQPKTVDTRQLWFYWVLKHNVLNPSAPPWAYKCLIFILAGSSWILHLILHQVTLWTTVYLSSVTAMCSPCIVCYGTTKKELASTCPATGKSSKGVFQKHRETKLTIDTNGLYYQLVGIHRHDFNILIKILP